ncbi:MAG TPA: HNH endonuclease [Nitrososphaera sp.]
MVEIPLTQGKVAFVDDDDLDLVDGYKWYAQRTAEGRWYAATMIRGYVVLMHRLLMNAQDGIEVDHINGNTLDNRRENMRFATRSQNMQNARKRKGTTSKYKGVSWQRGKWIVQIQINGKCSYLGRYSDEEEAARVYDEAAKEAFGEFASLNF